MLFWDRLFRGMLSSRLGSATQGPYFLAKQTSPSGQTIVVKFQTDSPDVAAKPFAPITRTVIRLGQAQEVGFRWPSVLLLDHWDLKLMVLLFRQAAGTI